MNLDWSQRSAFSQIGILLLCILIALLASLFYYLTYNQVSANNESRTITSKLTAQSVMEKIDRNFYERFGDVQAFAYNQLAVSAASQDTVVSGVQDFINTMTAYYVLYDLMMICNKEGRVLVVNTKDKNGNAINSGHLLRGTVSNEEWFKVCMSQTGPTGGAWFSDFKESPEIGRIYGTKGHGMAFAAPIKNADGSVVGVWYNYASWKEVTEGIREEAEQNLTKDHQGAFVLITKKTGSIISARDSSLVGVHSLKENVDGSLQTTNEREIALSNLTYSISRSKGAYTFAGKEWITVTFIPKEKVSWAIFFSRKNIVAVVVCLLVLTTVALYVLWFFRRNIINRINEIKNLQQRLSEGQIVEVADNEKNDEFGAIKKSLKILAENLKSKAAFADEISKGKLNIRLANLTSKDVLGNSLVHMQSQLQLASQTDSERNWLAEGLAQIGGILRSTTSVEELYSKIIKFVVTYLKANQGGLFILNETDGEKKLRLVSCYAYEKKKFIEKTIDIGQGMVGQCLVEKSTIYLTEIPENYMLITSGLGGASPRSLLIIPVKNNHEIYGVLELASFDKFRKHEIALAEKFTETVASSIAAIQKAEQTNLLLEQLQQQTEEMKAQEEEMRQNMEELAATQEDLIRKEREYINKKHRETI